MNPSRWLRITSIISLLFAAGHTLGGRSSWSPIGENDVLHAMGAFRFEVEGVSRTYLDFYLGFGFILSVYLFLQAVLLWQLAAIAKDDPLRARPLIASFFVASVVSALLSWKFIFAVPRCVLRHRGGEPRSCALFGREAQANLNPECPEKSSAQSAQNARKAAGTASAILPAFSTPRARAGLALPG